MVAVAMLVAMAVARVTTFTVCDNHEQTISKCQQTISGDNQQVETVYQILKFGRRHKA